MRGFRFILAIGFATALLGGGYALSTDLQPADSVTIDSQQDYRPSQKLDTAKPAVMQGVLGYTKSDRQKPRRARPAPRKSSRPKTVTQRTRQVGKEAQRRSAQRLQKAESSINAAAQAPAGLRTSKRTNRPPATAVGSSQQDQAFAETPTARRPCSRLAQAQEVKPEQRVMRQEHASFRRTGIEAWRPEAHIERATSAPQSIGECADSPPRSVALNRRSSA